MTTQKEDLAFGLSSEDKLLQTLDGVFGTRLSKSSYYSPMDFHNSSKTLYVELKTRRIAHDRYSTALIGLNKTHFCSDPEKKYYFVYCYTDGMYYIEYNKELFDTFDVDYEYVRGDRSDCINYSSSVVHIPISQLKKIDGVMGVTKPQTISVANSSASPSA